LADRKQGVFEAVLNRNGVVVFETAAQLISQFGTEGIPTALVTSSRNGREVLRRAGLIDAFDVIVDGTDAQRLRLGGKPQPDMFLYAADQLDVEPQDSIVVEDAVSGVQAARAGGFGMVVGVDHGEDSRRLKRSGADVVVSDLAAAKLETRTTRPFDPLWVLSYDTFEPEEEATREVLFHMANGYWGTRASYPGTSA